MIQELNTEFNSDQINLSLTSNQMAQWNITLTLFVELEKRFCEQYPQARAAVANNVKVSGATSYCDR